MKHDLRDAVVERLIRVAAMLKTGQLKGVSLSFTDLAGTTSGAHYLTPGAERLALLKDQLERLDP